MLLVCPPLRCCAAQADILDMAVMEGASIMVTASDDGEVRDAF